MTRNATRWSGDEDRVLARHFPEHGSVWDGWAELLPGRSKHSIASRAVKLKIRPDKRTHWSAEEDAKLVANYPKYGLKWDGWDDLLPGRTRGSIGIRANKIGLVTVRTMRNRAAAARKRAGGEGRRCGDCNQFLPSTNPTVDAGTCVSAELARHLCLQKRPSVLVTSDASGCEFFEPMQPLFRKAGGVSLTMGGSMRPSGAHERGVADA